MYSNIHRSSPTNTKYTDYVRKLNDEHVRQVNTPPLSIAKDKATKFADIFSPDESNALKLYFLQKASSSPNIISENSIGVSEEDEKGHPLVTSPISKRRRSADQSFDPPEIDTAVVQGQFENKLRTSSESVANIVYSSIRPDYHQTNPTNLPTGSDSKQDYDPHEPLPNVDQLALRHELLNNIRQISRATYFEDLYTGKVAHNDGPPEAEILEILQNSSNPQEEYGDSTVGVDEDGEKDRRVEHWVRESVKNSVDNDNEDVPMENSLYHQTVWNPPKESETIEDPDFDPPSEVESIGRQSRLNPIPNIPSPTPTNLNASNLPETNLPPQPISNPAISKIHREKRPYSFHQSGTDPSQFTSPTNLNPLLLPTNASVNNAPYGSAISSHLLGQRSYGNSKYNSNPASNSLAAIPDNMSYSPAPSNSFSRHLVSPPTSVNNPEQVQRLMLRNGMVVKGPPSNVSTVGVNTVRKQNNFNSQNSKVKIPRIYQRQNMNQWVAKKVWFYMNGDERFPRMEYRFRPRDLHTMDALLNMLNKKMPQLPTGARYLFAMDGRIIHSVDELQNEQSYVVSSTRKFKPSKYGRRHQQEDHNLDNTLHLPPLRKTMSTKYVNNLAPLPLIRIRRAKSVKSGAGGGDLKFSSSENNLTLLNNNLSGGGKNANTKSNSYTNINKNYNYNNYKNISPETQTGVKRGSVKVSKSSEVPRIVAEVIDAASVRGRMVERQMVRIINGADPSVQSQVLLNTKTSQPWKDLVKDLGMAVKLPRSRRVGNRMETLYGRQVHSYSQLRSELKVGNNAYYIYADSDEEVDIDSVPNLQRHRLSLIPNPYNTQYGYSNYHTANNNSSKSGGQGVGVRRSRSNVSPRSRSKTPLSQTISNSSSEFSMSSPHLNVQSPRRRPRRRSQTPSPQPERLDVVLNNKDGRSSQSSQYARRRKSASLSPSPSFNTSNRLETRSVHFHQ